jgi:hypothetical protein
MDSACQPQAASADVHVIWGFWAACLHCTLHRRERRLRPSVQSAESSGPSGILQFVVIGSVTVLPCVSSSRCAWMYFSSLFASTKTLVWIQFTNPHHNKINWVWKSTLKMECNVFHCLQFKLTRARTAWLCICITIKEIENWRLWNSANNSSFVITLELLPPPSTLAILFDLGLQQCYNERKWLRT